MTKKIYNMDECIKDLRSFANQVELANQRQFANALRKIADYLKTLPKEPEVIEWIPVGNTFPENEQEVEISCVRRYIGAGNSEVENHFTARAFYEDGTMTTENSNFVWDDYDNWEYIEEKDEYIIPEGWWEYVTFGESFCIVDAEVIAWRPVGEPYRKEVAG